MDWRKYDLVEYRKGRHRLERHTWSFWDWALALILVAVLWKFWEWLLAVVVVSGVGLALSVGAGALLAWVSRKR
jgi:hypothetical protein